MSRTSDLIEIAQRLAHDTTDFHTIKGPGKGDRARAEFIEAVQRLALDAFGHDYSEKKISGNTNFTVNFWFPEEETIVEIALTLRNSSSEFHKDIFKALLALDSGKKVGKLVFIAKPGAIKRHSEPASRAIMNWLKAKHGIRTEIIELT